MKAKRIYILIFSSLVLFFVACSSIAVTVSAADIVGDVCSQDTGSGDVPSVCKDNLSGTEASNPLTGPNGIITKGLQIFVVILGITAVVVFMINGLKLITSGGDANAVKTARNGVLYAIIGLVIAMSGQLIVSLILSKI